MKYCWKAYIKPFDDLGEYTDWIDVSDYVEFDGVGSITNDLDNTEYDIGVYRTSNFNITMNNEQGMFSDIGTENTIFRYKRSGSMLKLTWDIEPDGRVCGVALTGGARLSTEVDIFTGLLSDESLSMDLDTHRVSFSVLGRESIFQKVIVPFGTISNGDLFSEVIYNCLNQTAITDLLTLDVADVTVGIDLEIDSIASLQNKTVQEGLNKLLLASNSVLYVSGDSIVVSPRTATATVQYTFYGQASDLGPENIQSIKKIKGGLARVFNYFVWKENTTPVQDASSVAKYGIRKKDLDFEFITDAGKQQDIMEALRDEFANPKQEFDLYTPLGHPLLAIDQLDRISIDYPTVPIQAGEEIPIFAHAIAGTAVCPKAQWSFKIDPLDHYKVIGRSIDAKAATIKFKMRAI